jgi:uncharacterized protein YceK
MKYKVSIISLTCLINFSCSTITTHNVTFGHPYSGTEVAIKNFPCRTVNSMNYSMLNFPFVFLDMPFSFVFLDMPFSFVLDTVLLPVDLFVSPKIGRKFTTEHDDKCV